MPFVLDGAPSLPVDSVQALVALARRSPASWAMRRAAGAPHHIYMELFKSMTGTDMKHVPYRGGGPALDDVARATCR